MPTSASFRFRQTAAALVLTWAMLALLAGLRARVEMHSTPQAPVAITEALGISRVVTAAPAAQRAGVQTREKLIARAGARHTFQQPGGAQYTVQLPPQSPAAYNFPAEAFAHWGLLLCGALCLGIAFAVFPLKRERREAWVLLLYSGAVAALLFSLSPATGALTVMAGMSLPFAAAAAFHLFTVTPAEARWMAPRRRLRTYVYCAAALVAALTLLRPWAGALAAPIEVAAWLFYGFVCAAGVAALFGARALAPDAPGAVIVLLAALLGFAPLCVVLLWHVFFGLWFPWQLVLLGLFAAPAAVVYGITRREFLEVRALARGSAVYGAATFAISGGAALLVTTSTTLFERLNIDASSPLLTGAFLFVALLAFDPLHGRVQALVDRLFDRDRANYRRAVREITDAMVSMNSAKVIVDRILAALTATMGVERALVLLARGAGRGAGRAKLGALDAEAWRGDWDEEAAKFSLPKRHPLYRNLAKERRVLAREDFDEEADPELREQCRDVFDSLEINLLVPVLFGNNLLGAIAVGQKLSGAKIGADERQLLRTLANQSAVAIENARAFAQIEQLSRTLEARVEERTRELRDTQAQLMQSEKMRSLGQLVAGVAHELNNPIGFVHANLALLADYTGKLGDLQLPAEKRARAREAIAKLLARSREGTTRVKEIVQNLRAFSRTDQADLQRVALNDEIDRTLGLMEPRLKGGIKVVRAYGALPLVRCFAGQLNQVFMNLLMNACDALEGRGTITVRTRANEAEGFVLLEFEDDGPGMSAKVQQRIFEPFFTTKPAGQGTGFGLSLSYGIIEGHGGALTAASREGHGTTFTIKLPLQPPAELFAAAANAATVSNSTAEAPA